MFDNNPVQELDKDQSECTICFNSFDSLESVRKDKCNHYFHYECIFKLAVESNKVCCPLSKIQY